MKKNKFLLIGLSCICLLAVTGCRTGQFVSYQPQSGFNYPNSNVTPLGPVKVSVPGPSYVFGQPDWLSSDSEETVYKAALAQYQGANLITDYVRIYKKHTFWPFTWTKLELEGTACKMEVGKQTLK